MTDGATVTGLADWVRETLSRDIQLKADLLVCLESLIGSADIELLLADTESSEAASFLDLLFSPDAQARYAYEVRWGEHRFTQQGVRAVVEAVGCGCLIARLHVPDRRDPMELVVPAYAQETFVQRLNIAWQPPPALARMLAARLTEDHRCHVRAMLRHVRVPWHAHQVALIDLLLARMAPTAETFDEDLAFVCTLLDEFGPEQTPFDFLMAKKRFYFQALCKALAFEQRLRAASMEMLMLQGARAAYGDIEQWRGWMRQVDRISVALFGVTHYFQEPLSVAMAPQP